MPRQQRIRGWLHSVLFDCRFAFRQLRKEPGVTATVVITLALGIGVNTAMFSLLSGWLLRALPVPSPGQITVLASEQDAVVRAVIQDGNDTKLQVDVVGLDLTAFIDTRKVVE
jgi:hypothetical protein